MKQQPRQSSTAPSPLASVSASSWRRRRGRRPRRPRSGSSQLSREGGAGPDRRAAARHGLERRPRRAALPDQRQPVDAGHRGRGRERHAAGAAGVGGRHRRGLPDRQPRDAPARDLHRPGSAPALRDVPPRRWQDRQAADGPGRRPPVESRAGESLQHPAEGRDRREPRRRDRDLARQGHPADPAAAGDEVHQARAHPEREADEVLGAPDVPRRAHPAAAGLRRASRRALPAGHRPRPLPVHVRRLPRGASRPDAEAGLLGALPLAGLQPDRAGTGAPVLQGLDRAQRSRASC